MEVEPNQPPEAWPEDEMNDWEPSDDVGFDSGPMPDNMSGSGGPGGPGGPGGRGGPGNFRNRRYREAYGNYSGGYEQGGFRRPMFKPYDYSGPPFAMGARGPGPRFPMGRGYGPQGPRGPGPMGPIGPPVVPMRHTYDRVVKFLMRCGMVKENVKNLPRGLVNLISPHYCGVCGMEFESFSISRIHYGSKNHLKSQKKWIAQCNGETCRGSNSGKELPLKSRDLYCELCDVHITSKVHAESHYAGKNHRAIVMGRKKPKNPFLLQEGMEGRVEQLIRREKRNLKPDGADDGDAKEAKEPPKILNPELYCNICKTSMTNTEQMMMHLNGKRHLFKEKQHILRVMKGEPDPAPAPAPAREPSEDMVEGDESSAMAKDQDKEEANGDEEDASGEKEQATEASGDNQDASTIDEWQNGGGEQW